MFLSMSMTLSLSTSVFQARIFKNRLKQIEDTIKTVPDISILSFRLSLLIVYNPDISILSFRLSLLIVYDPDISISLFV